jgi:hypothetical protein
MRHKIIESLKDNIIQFKIQLFISGIATGILSWNLVTFAKGILLRKVNLNLNTWTYIFFHPHESNLANYIFLSIAIGLYGLFIYIFVDKNLINKINDKLKDINPFYQVSLIIISAAILATSTFLPSSLRIATALIVLFIPATYFINFARVINEKTLLLLTLILLVMLSLEPLNIINSPVYLMNEYDDIYTDTYLNNRYVNNKIFIEDLGDVDVNRTLGDFIDVLKAESRNVVNYRSLLQRSRDVYTFFVNFKYINLDPVQKFIVAKMEVKSEPEIIIQPDKDSYDKNYSVKKIDANLFLTSLKKINLESIKMFYLANYLEYSYQNMSRGQINHIGHLLNPINEYEDGKPLKDIYMQYGLGNTFLMKWTMELFGGTSIENYYKCYIYYVIYFIVFLIMLFYLFKDRLFVFGSFVILAASHYSYRHIGFILAPGIIPTIHFFDAAVLILLLLFFRHNNTVYLWFVALLAAVSVIINPQFGYMLLFSLLTAFIVYAIENKVGKHKYLWLSGSLIFFISVIMGSFFIPKGSVDIFQYFMLGFFSWPANRIVILLTICYLVISYFFMFLLRDKRFYLKYIYLFLFVYVQCLFVYFYWSGLINHLPMVTPFAGLQLFLMTYIAEKELFSDNPAAKKMLDIAKNAIVLFALLSLAITVRQFYKDKSQFNDNFADHKTYNWKFERANIVTTIDPAPVEESINLIRKYSKDNNGVYMISGYDNLFLFLAGKYSLMPHFQMAWYLISDKEHYTAVNRMKKDKPEYIFVDTNIDKNNLSDPWAKIYNSIFDLSERTSRLGRYSELRKVFNEIAYDYEPIEKGHLITVYKRRH